MTDKTTIPLENVIEATDYCRYCLMCRHMCPVGHVTLKETLTPHGWGLTIASVRRGLLTWDAGTVDVLYSCADCGTCRSHCVTDQPLPDAIAAARAEVAGQGLAPAVVYEMESRLREWGNPYREQAPQAPGGTGKDALFVGDDAAYLRPAALDAALKLLKAAGVEPVLIGVGRSSGQLASSLGLPDVARELAQATLDDLKAAGARRLFVLSPGDYYTFSQLHGERLGIAWPEDVALVEVVTFLAGRLEEGALAFQPSADEVACVYADPTHAVRVETRHDAPRRLLLAALPAAARELFWRRERAHPVGSTALQYTSPHIARHLTYSRLDDVRKSGAQVVISEDPATLHEMEQVAGRFGLRVQGLYELLAARLA